MVCCPLSKAAGACVSLDIMRLVAQCRNITDLNQLKISQSCEIQLSMNWICSNGTTRNEHSNGNVTNCV